MNCAEIRLLLHAQTDGELDAANSREAERHVKVCEACAAELKALRTLGTALRDGNLSFRAPESLRRDVQQFARDMQGETVPRGGAGAGWIWRLIAGVSVAFSLLVLCLRPLGISGQDTLANELIAGHVRSLQVSHLTDVASTDQHTVKPWFDGKLDFAPEVRDFTAQGFPLIGGRLDYLGDRPVAALVYRHDKHFINVFVRPMASGGAQERNLTVRGYAIASINSQGLIYYFVSDLNPKSLHDFAKLFGDSL